MKAVENPILNTTKFKRYTSEQLQTLSKYYHYTNGEMGNLTLSKELNQREINDLANTLILFDKFPYRTYKQWYCEPIQAWRIIFGSLTNIK